MSGHLHSYRKIRYSVITKPLLWSIFLVYSAVQAQPFLNWQDVSQLTFEAQKRTIAEIVRQMHESKRLTDYETTLTRGNNWFSAKIDHNDKWLAELISLEDEYQKALNDYQITENKIRDIKNSIEIEESNSRKITDEINNIEENIKHIQFLKQENKKNLEARLAKIPTLVLMIGYVPKGNIDKEDRKTLISDDILNQAISHINTVEITSLSVVKDNKLVRDFIEARVGGFAKTVDVYPKDFERAIGKESYTFLLHLLEVYPFRFESDEENQSESNRVNELKRRYPDIIKQIKSYPIKGLVGGDSIARAPVRLNDTEKNYVQTQLQYVALINDGVEKKIQARLVEFRSKESRYDQMLSEYFSKRQSRTMDRDEKRKKISNYQSELDTINLRLNEDRLKLQNKRRSYETHYQSKIEWVNALKQGPDIGTVPETYYQLGIDCVKEIKAKMLSKTRQEKIIVIDNQLKSSKSQTVNYEASIKSYQVLYVSQKDLDGQVAYIVNVAFELIWQQTGFAQDIQSVSPTPTNCRTEVELISQKFANDTTLQIQQLEALLNTHKGCKAALYNLAWLYFNNLDDQRTIEYGKRLILLDGNENSRDYPDIYFLVPTSYYAQYKTLDPFMMNVLKQYIDYGQGIYLNEAISLYHKLSR